MTTHWRAVTAACGVASIAGCSYAPMNYMFPHGPVAASQATLGWWCLVVSCVVILVISILVLAGARRRPETIDAAPRSISSGLGWIYIGGVALPLVVLVLTFGFTMGTLRAVAIPDATRPMTVQVIGHRWWWELRYAAYGENEAFVTANELHVPLRVPVRLELSTADVIHSFWIPRLAGKTDLIPGQTNRAWLQADLVGTYRGQCTEYCGLQHANMAAFVVAQPAAEFEAWVRSQTAPARAPADSLTTRGLAVFQASCGACHTVRGTTAAGRVGPDLTHFASRSTIAGGALPNLSGNLIAWITNSQSIKPGSDMPPMPLPPADMHALLAYLATLR